MKREKHIKTDHFTNSSIVQFLIVLDREEIKEFARFVDSPFHNNRSDVSRFLEVLKKYHPGFNAEDFSKEKVYSILYPGSKYRDDVIRRLSSNLFKLGEEYASYKKFRENKFEYEKHLLDHYSSKSVDKFFLKQLEKIKDEMEAEPFRGGDFFYKQSIINEAERVYNLKNDPTYKKIGFEEQITNLWKFSLASILRLYGFAEYETFFFNKKYDLSYCKPLAQMAEDHSYLGSKAIEIYSLILKLYSDGVDEQTFFDVKELIEKNISIFEKHEGFSLYVHLINYCNISELKLKKDNTAIKFGLVKKMHEKGLIASSGVIDPGWFRGIFMMAFNAGEIKFAEQFVEMYKEKIDGEDKSNVIDHVYAQLAVQRKEHDAALDHLSTASYSHVNDKMTIKFLYLKIYYEIDNYEQFSYCADSLKHLIKEEGSFNENITLPIRNFITISTRLFRTKLKEIDIPADEIRNEILNTNAIMRKWLLEKTDELPR